MSQTKAQLIDTLVASLLPASDSAVDIGSNAVRFANIYGDTLYGNGANLTGINTDLVSDTSPQLGGDLDTNSFEILLDDNHAVKFGNDVDLTVLHSGSTGVINNVTGDLHIKTTGSGDDIVLISNDDIELQPQAGEAGIKVIGNGAVELYHDNSLKVSTSSAGAIIQNGHLILNRQDTGNEGGELVFNRASDNANQWFNDVYGADTSARLRWHNGGVEYLSLTPNSELAAKAGIDIKIASDTGKFLAGTGGDLQIYHDGTNSFIKNTTLSSLYINSTSHIYLANTDNSEFRAKFHNNSSVELYHDNSKKFETTSTGVTVTGTLETTSGINSGSNISMNDNVKLKAGTGDDLQIYHDGSHSRILDSGTGHLILQTSEMNLMNVAGNEDMIKAHSDGNVELYYDNSKKFESTSYGTFTSGTHALSENLDIANDTGRIKLGTNADLQLYHNGSASFIQSPSHTLFIQATTIDIGNGAGNEAKAKFIDNGAVELYYDNSKKFETVSNGVHADNRILVGDSMNSRGFFSGDASSVAVGSIGSLPFYLRTNSASRWQVDASGHFLPAANNTYDIGTTSYRVRNIFTHDLNLSNEGGANDVDGTWGSYTIQEGKESLFLINKRSGKKYKFNLTEVA